MTPQALNLFIEHLKAKTLYKYYIDDTCDLYTNQPVGNLITEKYYVWRMPDGLYVVNEYCLATGTYSALNIDTREYTKITL